MAVMQDIIKALKLISLYKCKVIKIASWVLVILWMALIFNLSSQVAEHSNNLSTGLTQFIINIIEKFLVNLKIDVTSLNSIFRKVAHFITYLILGILVINALQRSKQGGCQNIVVALGICILYAISDEIHQLFVLGRGPRVLDIVIDSAGSSGGIGFYKLLEKIYKSKR